MRHQLVRDVVAPLWVPRAVPGFGRFDASLVIDRAGLIHAMNPAASVLAERGNLYRGVPGTRIAWAWPALEVMAANSLQTVRDCRALSVADPSGARHMLMLSSESGSLSRSARIDLFVRDMVGLVEEQVRRSVAVFGFTPSEKALAESMLLGRSLEAHAGLRGSAISTVRKQVAALFYKTGTSRQAEMTAALLAVGAAGQAEWRSGLKALS